MSNLDQTLSAAAAAAATDANATAQEIHQTATPAETSVVSVQTGTGVVPSQPAQALSMDSSVVQAQSSIGDFLKLTDGGCEVNEKKYGEVIVRLHIESAEKHGSFKPAFMMNYEANGGSMVYTKSYDGATTTSGNPAHSGLSWVENKAKILGLNPKAFDYLGYDIAMVVNADVLPLKGEGTLEAGTVLGFTTPYTAAKTFKKIWDESVANNRGKDAIVKVWGEEISKNNKKFKILHAEILGYEDHKSVSDIKAENSGE